MSVQLDTDECLDTFEHLYASACGSYSYLLFSWALVHVLVFQNVAGMSSERQRLSALMMPFAFQVT